MIQWVGLGVGIENLIKKKCVENGKPAPNR